MAAQLKTHTCPGGCGTNVTLRLFACRTDWYRLPIDLRRPILDTAHLPLLNHSRADAVADAVQWYGKNPTTAAASAR
jgi:hypothetical protein